MLNTVIDIDIGNRNKKSLLFNIFLFPINLSRHVQPKALGSLIGGRAGQLEEKQRKNSHVMDSLDPRDPRWESMGSKGSNPTVTTI